MEGAEKPSLAELYVFPLTVLALVLFYAAVVYVVGNLKNEQPPSDLGDELSKRF